MSRPRAGLFVLGGLGVAVLVALWWFRAPPAAPPPPPAEDDGDPRLTFPTPYRNVRPEVKYVGDAVCAKCHARVAAAYAEHPMSRSLAPVGQMRPVERYDAVARNPFESGGFRFEVARAGDRMTHRESRRDPHGGAPVRLESDVHFAVGSGVRGRTYLTERDGCLFQSPISWYSEKGIWDLTPGLSVTEHFERPARAGCLFCHCNSVEPVAHTLNRYRPPLFRGHGIGCERCHGPGELHAAARGRGEGPAGADETIVNPARLAPELRDAVCAQCHLQGEVRVVRRGREIFDYRPGLPLHLFLSVFTRAPEFADGPSVGGHVEQVQASRCFQGSGGRLGCVSCHDPHAVPAPETKVAHYRGRCLQCHTDGSCSLTPAARRQQNPADSCIDCHMPRAESRIAHTAVADHRVPRRPEPPRAAAPPRALRLGEVPLLHFHRAHVDPFDPGVARDLGLALTEVGMKYPAVGRLVGPPALPLLDAAAESRPDDVAAWEARGFLRWQLGRRAEGLEDLRAALARAPEREEALTYAAVLAAALGHDEEAVGYWRRAVAVNPWASQYRARLARLLADRRDWAGALGECEAALRLNPFDDQTRALREECLRESGKAVPPR
jgi:predicted CXXCH cytochrome family protein